jgi:uncharacterized LabA/DUF88 family protein
MQAPIVDTSFHFPPLQQAAGSRRPAAPDFPPEGSPKVPAASAAGFIPRSEFKKRRVAFFVDGFNLYHSIDDLDRDPQTRQNRNTKHFLKWLDLKSLANALIKPDKEIVTQGFYFSAHAHWLSSESQQRQRLYLSALRSTGMTTVMGRFKKSFQSCPKCKHQRHSYHEKESDVNLAVHLVKLAFENRFDKAIVFTADTDLAPAIREVRQSFPAKEVRIAIPEKRLNRTSALEHAASGRIRLTESHFARNLLPEKIMLPNGSTLQRPEKYRV